MSFFCLISEYVNTGTYCWAPIGLLASIGQKLFGWMSLLFPTAMPKSPFGIALIVSPILLWSGYAA